MARVKFGEWSPDQPCFENYGMFDVRNAVPSETGHYEPFPSLQTLTSSITASVQSAIAARAPSGAGFVFAATEDNLYKQSVTGWADVSRTASYSANTEAKWSFAQFGDTVYACNGKSAMQYYTLGTSTRFLDMSASASAPVATYLTTVRDHVFAATITNNVNRVQWPRINNPTRWTSSVRFQADFQDIPSGGKILGVTGGDFACILTENSVYRASYVGSPLIFRFDELVPGIGCAAPYSTARFQNVTFFYSKSGFYAFDGNQAYPIGDNKIDDWFNDNADPGSFDNMSAAIDPIRKLYVVSFASKSSGGTADRCLVYNWATQRWSYLTVGFRTLFGAVTTGYTLEGLDAISSSLDALDASLDSSQWIGGSQYFAAFNNGNQLGEFTGPALTARFETGCSQLFEGRRAFMREVRPLLEGNGAAVQVQVGHRDRLVDSITFDTASAMNSNGWCPVRSNGRYHRVRMEVSSTFTHAVGFDYDAVPEGRR